MTNGNKEAGRSQGSSPKKMPAPEPIPEPDPKLRGRLTEEKRPSSTKVASTRVARN